MKKTTKKRRNFKQKGISPLIATVLILGFTVVLAVLVINWAIPFVRNIQDTTEETSNVQILCAQDVVFNIRNVCDSGTNQIKILVANDGVRKIDEFTVRSYRSDSDVEQDKMNFATLGIDSFNIDDDTITVDSEPIKQIELIPSVTINNKKVTCSNNIRRFGNLESTGLEAC
jgi:flagellin-like protein